MMIKPENYHLRKAVRTEAERIWGIILQAIERRKNDGSQQWQDGYPNLETIKTDIENGNGFVLESENQIIAYAALIFNDEPAYEKIIGECLTNDDFLVIHRVAISNEFLGKGIVKKMFSLFEDFAREKNVFSIKVDTNFDNLAMLSILEKLGYHYCGEVYFRGAARKAFEKKLQKK